MTFIEIKSYQAFIMKFWLVLGNFWLIFREMAKIYIKARNEDRNFVSLDSDAQFMTFIEIKSIKPS